MEQTFAVETAASPDELFSILGDLATYPHWLDVVTDVVLESQSESESESSEGTATDSAWTVTLRARVGPFTRSKRLRMVRTLTNSTTRTVVFERRERDGREHSGWKFQAVVEEGHNNGMPSTSTLRLTYGGAMWSGLLDGILGTVAERATAALQQYAAQSSRID